ncbi:MAG: SDR family oxidoreductase [Cytophagaceae bacterium]|jgi:NAD(P)-dependent dehydrogenase (short-subunit alcohol dehydrogenase family)|nr:SDR family oxidoreductase [Cytophagaceae bacterium]
MKNILITGVSSGIGEALAKKLLEEGYRVIGSYRILPAHHPWVESYRGRFVALEMDVTSETSLQEAFQRMKELLGQDPLYALINNAGIAKSAPLEKQSMSDIHQIFDVNVFGAIRVTQLFLPFMKRNGNSGARIVNISSGAGKLAIPFLGAYAASKHALEALSGSLRRELMPFGIDVVLVGPGNVRTPIWDKAQAETQLDTSEYRQAHRNFFNYMVQDSKHGMTPDQIAVCIHKILAHPKPAVRYAPVAQKLANWYIPRLLPERWIDRMMFSMMKSEQQKDPTKN